MSRSLLRAATVALGLAVTALPAAAQGGRGASPRDSASATINGATVAVNYGSPSKRGREIYGGLVPWGQVWRAGANEATRLTTSKALQFGATTVPAGSYSLFVLPQQDGKWQLVINKQVGQWGTNYDLSQDLARVPLTVTQVPATAERMTFTVDKKGNAGELALTWDRTRAAAPFTVK